MKQNKGDGFLGILVLCLAFIGTAIYVAFILPFRRQGSIRQNEAVHQLRVKSAHRGSDHSW